MSNDTQIMIQESRPTGLGPGWDSAVATTDSGDNRISPLLKIHNLLKERYKYAIPAALGLAIGAGILGYISSVPKYRSYGQVNISQNRPDIFNKDTNAIQNFDTYMALQANIIMSSRTIDVVMNQRMNDVNGVNPDYNWEQIRKNNFPVDPEQAANEFGKHLTVEVNRGNIVVISYLDKNPNVAKACVQRIIEAYNFIYNASDSKSLDNKRDNLNQLRTEYNNQIKAINDQISSVPQEYGGPEALRKIYFEKLNFLGEIENEYNKAEMDLKIAEANSESKPSDTQPTTNQAGTSTKPFVLRSAEDLEGIDPQVKDLMARYRAVKAERDALLTRFAERNPTVVNNFNLLQTLQEQIQSRVAQLNQDRANDKSPEKVLIPGENTVISLPQLRRMVAIKRETFERAKAEALDLGKKVTQIDRYLQDLKDKELKRKEADDSLATLNYEAMIGGRLTILEKGTTPVVPDEDKRYRNAAVAGLGGALMGLGIFALIGLMDRTVKNLSDVENANNRKQRLLGILPTLPDDLADPEQAAFAAHCVHRIRTMLEVGIEAGRRRVVTVTSPMPGDGKTSLTLALGLSFAAADSKTLLIDCDVVGGGLTARMKTIIRRKIGDILRREGLLSDIQLDQALNIAQQTGKKLGEVVVELGLLTKAQIDEVLVMQKESAVGLLDVLDGAVLNDCITGTGTPGLSILPLGSARAHLTGHISPKAIRRIIEEARQNYDVTLIDTGPLLGSLETSIIAIEADEVILTVARGEQRPLVNKAIELIHQIGARLSGLVYNRAKAEDIESSDFSPSTRLSIMRSQPLDPELASLNVRPQSSGRLGPIAGAVVTSTRSPSGSNENSPPNAS